MEAFGRPVQDLLALLGLSGTEPMPGDDREASYDPRKSVTFTMGLDIWGHRKMGSLELRRAKNGRRDGGTLRSLNLADLTASSCHPTCSRKVRE